MAAVTVPGPVVVRTAADVEGGPWRKLANEIHLVAVNMIFLQGYVILFWVLLLIAGTLYGYVPMPLAASVAAVIIVDFLVPLPKPPFFSEWFFRRTTTRDGMLTYFPSKLVMEFEPEKDRNYLICSSPHGLYVMGFHLIAYEFTVKHGMFIQFLGASLVKFLPFLRRPLSWWAYTGVEQKPFVEAIQRPYPFNVAHLTPGGISEMFYGISREQIILKRRKGFIKLAMQNGVDLVPCYHLGLNQQFRRLVENGTFLAKVSGWLHISLSPWLDRFLFPFGGVPIKHPLLVAVGKPIVVEKVVEPTQEQIDELHERFCVEIRALFDRYKTDPIFADVDGWEKRKLLFEDEELEKPGSSQSMYTPLQQG